MQITMLLSNGFGPDPRVAAEAVALQKSGHQVTIFAWDRSANLPLTEDYQGVRVVRCRIQTTYSRGPLQIFKFFRFWRECRRFLQADPPQAVHCHDLDTLQAGVTAAKRLGILVIYDAHESYPDMVAHLFPTLITNQIRRMERRLLPQARTVITVGSVLAAHFRELGARRVVIVGNYKTLPAGEFTPPDVPPPLKLIYVGGLNRDRLLEPVIRAVAGLERFQFYVVGDGPARAELQEAAGAAANIIFTGFLPQNEARALLAGCHLLYYGIDGAFPNNQYSTPNSLFMAMAAGRPVFCTPVGEIARIVADEACGTVLPDLEAQSILTALDRYLDQPSTWHSQAEASFRAAQERYNWDAAAATLVETYKDLEKQG